MTAAAGDAQDGEVAIGGVAAALCLDCRSASVTLAGLGVVEDRVVGVDGVLGLGVAGLRCPPVFLDRGPDPGIGIHRLVLPTVVTSRRAA
jgi:hypothetical protein